MQGGRRDGKRSAFDLVSTGLVQRLAASNPVPRPSQTPCELLLLLLLLLLWMDVACRECGLSCSPEVCAKGGRWPWAPVNACDAWAALSIISRLVTLQ